MTTLGINITTRTLLDCASCMPADVILCVNPDKIAAGTCTAPATGTPTARNTIPGTLAAKRIASVDCYGKTYEYLIQYDSDDITVGQTLGPTDIYQVFCKDCFAKWVEDMVGDPISAVVTTDPLGARTLTITNQYGCIYTVLLDTVEPLYISNDGGNIIIIGSDGGLYAPTTPIALSKDAHNGLSFGGDGNLYYPDAETLISTDVGNILAPGTDDLLFVPPQNDDSFVQLVAANAAGGLVKRHTSSAGLTMDVNDAPSQFSLTRVGAGNSIQAFSQAGGILTVTGAYEHTSYAQLFSETSGFTVTDVNSLATFTQDRIVDATIVNPSATRSMNLFAVLNASVLLTVNTNANFAAQLRAYMRENAGAWFLRAQNRKVLILPGTFLHYDEQYYPLDGSYIYVATLGPGATLKLSVRLEVQTTMAASVSASWADGPVSLRVFGMTI